MEEAEKFAVIKTGGKQYKVKAGDILKVEKLSKENLEFKDILFGKTVTASLVTEGRLPKVRVLKFHPKKRYKRVLGHRQNFTQIKIEKIV
ncbi:MAG: 50S ribosomal protein L21 [Berkelbacteria bacterium GW2011_GWB1_38_5]|uniref:Large ribosomal subunit protein bL21 n=2 Tax=Candidatus Berkelbacteria TaxID=1618330 RepID=A0A0G0I1K6_9BACT|nr:MAG: 50S ribosomal protein L21 [Berkelbacteria bacterium GW2011_GWA1_36_9]KKQ72544.1 MAG: 50S ribosomal protein L21 [Berkelbacteria bacterium GW2011_GWB1_38_5]